MTEVEYKIIGGDGAEYGPALLEEIQSWIREGRVARSTQVWRSDTSLWLTADRYSELQADLARLYASVSAAPTVAGAELRPTGFWARLGAYVVDHIILAMIFVVLWGPIAASRHWQSLPPPMPATFNDAALQQFRQQFAGWANRALLVYYPLFLFYEVLLNGTFGATLGKMAIGAKILMVDGSAIGYGTAFLRWVGARFSDFLLGAGYLLIAIRPDKRALHDLLAGTKVVYKK